MDRPPDVGGDRRIARPEERQRAEIGFGDRAVDQDAQQARGHAVAGRVDRRDPVEVDRAFRVILDDLEVGMFHHDLIVPQAGFSKEDDPLAAGDHLLHPRHVIPAAEQRLAENVGILLLDPRLKNPPWPEPPVGRLFDFAKKANRNLRRPVGETVEQPPVLVAIREMVQEVAESG